uniref:Uncharacterized protein n=1 Tax=Hydrodictyon reticulatum TaxID=3107 RepID=A0A1W5RMV3_HYDRE|nr:hypothetical protein [Hydrodictyon reticulatum]YP_009364243.1 hypothetical protein [Hydrodictyon reticulatum]AQU64529.1 hypothetical protein [Hydrodictyon reticulatum]AQU64530.1 hypothetical protein [Hydrodictyon reticulatum]
MFCLKSFVILRFSAKPNRFFALASAEPMPMPSLFGEAEPLLRFCFGGADAFASLWLRRSRCLRFSAKPNRFFASASAPPMPMPPLLAKPNSFFASASASAEPMPMPPLRFSGADAKEEQIVCILFASSSLAERSSCSFRFAPSLLLLRSSFRFASAEPMRRKSKSFAFSSLLLRSRSEAAAPFASLLRFSFFALPSASLQRSRCEGRANRLHSLRFFFARGAKQLLLSLRSFASPSSLFLPLRRSRSERRSRGFGEAKKRRSEEGSKAKKEVKRRRKQSEEGSKAKKEAKRRRKQSEEGALIFRIVKRKKK